MVGEKVEKTHNFWSLRIHMTEILRTHRISTADREVEIFPMVVVYCQTNHSTHFHLLKPIFVQPTDMSNGRFGGIFEYYT